MVRSPVALASNNGMKLVGYGVDTFILNVRYADKAYQPVKQELSEELARELDYLQGEAKKAECAVATDWAFMGSLLFIEPHGAGRQWRWLLTNRLITLVVSPGRFNDIIAQVRFSSEFLWSESWCGDALHKVHEFLMSIFGQYITLQVSEIHLCADITGFDFSQVDYENCFVSRVRKQDATYGADGVALDCRKVATLRFSSHASPLSCSIYNKTLEIKQKSGKTWFYDLWRKHGWDGASDVWRVEFRFKRSFLRNLEAPIEGAYEVLDQFQSLWAYAAGRPGGAADGLPDGWLRLVVPGADSNRSRWSLHPVWELIQNAFQECIEEGLGQIVRKRIRQRNIERGLAAVIGYISTLAAWIGGEYAAPNSDLSLMLQWLYGSGLEYLEEKQRDYIKEVLKKQALYGVSSNAVEVTA